MNIALHSCDNYFFAVSLATSSYGITNNVEGSLRRVRTHKELGQEQGFLFKTIAHKIEGRNHIFIDNFQRCFLFQSNCCRFFTFTNQALNYRIKKAHFTNDCCPCFRSISVTGNILLATVVKSAKCEEAVVRIHHHLTLRIDNGTGQPNLQRKSIEHAVDKLTSGQAKRNIRNTHHSVNASLTHRTDNFASHLGIFATSTNSQSQRINSNIPAGNSILPSFGDNFFCNGNASRHV